MANVGRGNAVDERALLAALRSGRIAGAYLDVFDGEPGPRSENRSATGGILGEKASGLPPNLVAMPHSSAFCGDYLRLCFEELKNEGFF